MKKTHLRKIFLTFAKADPEPRTELNYGSTFQLLVAVMLSAQATDKKVNNATAKLFKDAPTAEAMLALGEESLKSYIRNIGLYNNKAKNLIALSRRLIECYSGNVPEQREALESLPGVGRKTANVVLNTAFEASVIGVDTHIFRVAHRLGLATGKTPSAVEAELTQAIPQEFMKRAHIWLVLHGRYVCKARKPMCWNCRIAQWCPYPAKTPRPTVPVR